MSSEKRSYELRMRAERQQATRRRIVQATVGLHQEVGPARTTRAEIARRAGVTRATVYNHFPADNELFAACQQQFLAGHPMPDFSAALAHEDVRACLEAALLGLYSNYRSRAVMLEKVQQDRSALPELDALMRRTLDTQLMELQAQLTRRFSPQRKADRTLRASLALALAFGSWRLLSREGLSDRAAAGLMTELVTPASDLRDPPI